METKIKPLKIGQTTIVFEQLFSSQARSDYQELMFKLAFGLPAKNLEYLIDFEHRYGVNDIGKQKSRQWHQKCELGPKQIEWKQRFVVIIIPMKLWNFTVWIGLDSW